MTLRELNRALLARQMLLERRRSSVVQAVSRLVGLQAQYAPSPYVALWARLEGFRKEQLTRALQRGAAIKTTSFRTTLHVLSGAEFPEIASSYAETQRTNEQRRVDSAALLRALPERPLTGKELAALAAEVLGTDDPWRASFALRPLPLVRTAPIGPWPHTKPSPAVLWRESLPDPRESAIRVVRAYVAAYGPATREDVQQFTGFRLGQIDPGLERLAQIEPGLFDTSRAPRPPAATPAPVRFLPAFDSILLAHCDRARIIPPAYLEIVINQKNATTKNVFTVDGFVAGAWRLEGSTLRIDPFAPLPLPVRREVDAEGERLRAWYLG